MSAALGYSGPQCPRCHAPLASDEIRSGAMTCRTCRGDYEATAFSPPERRQRVVELAVSGPEGANACANHARNAAVTSCQRCGLFICSLCDMNLGEGSLCPSCFERVRKEGTLQAAVTRYRDYASMARVTIVIAILFALGFGTIFAPLAIYYARKGAAQRRSEGESTTGMTVITVLGVLVFVGNIVGLGFLILGAMQ